MNKIIFLGTGAGGLDPLKQPIKTSSLYFEVNNLKFILDPGPGTIINAIKNKINLLQIDGIIVTHPHPDHYNDVNSLIDALRKKDSFLIANEKCLIPSKNYFPCIGKFQQTIPEKLFSMKPGKMIKIKKIKFIATPSHHLDCGMGIQIISNKKIGYVGDGYLKGIEKYHEGMDLLIFNVLCPYPEKSNGIHTTVNEIIIFLNKLKKKPKKVIIQHFSSDMLKANVDKQAKIIEKETKIKTIAAKDEMIIKF